MSNDSKLTDLIIQERVRGRSYYEIEQKHGIAALEARELVREALESTSIDDEWEQRGIMMLRIERVIEHLWSGVERGEFKHAEVMIKAVEQLSEMLALNKEVIKDQQAAITDDQAALIYMIITENNRRILTYINEKLKPNKKQLELLEVWPQVSADSATHAVETVLYVDAEEE